MKNNMKFLLSILSLIFVLSACKKYEEGPTLSLTTKKYRVSGDWKAERIISKSGDVEFVQSNVVWRINKDETFEVLEGNSIIEKGTWDFSQNKDYLMFTSKDEGTVDVVEYRIIRLKNNEMWLMDSEGEQINYVPAD